MTDIVAAEARYGEMWAQDASAIYGYAVSSAVSAQLVGFSDLISSAPDVVMSFASPVASAFDAEALDAVRLVSGLDALELPLLDAVNHNKATWADFGSGLIGLASPAKDDAGGSASGTATAVAAAAPVGRTRAVANLGNASAVRSLSVPASWYSTAPTMTAGTASDGTGWTVPHMDHSNAAIPLVRGIVASGNGTGASPRYGVKPTVMPKHGLF